MTEEIADKEVVAAVNRLLKEIATSKNITHVHQCAEALELLTRASARAKLLLAVCGGTSEKTREGLITTMLASIERSAEHAAQNG